MTFRKHKYKVAAKADRIHRGVIYDSKAEMNYAIMLDELVDVGEVTWWVRQVKIPLGEDNAVRIDFMVAEPVGQTSEVDVFDPELQRKEIPLLRVYGVEVKGVETARWRRQKKLWSKYGPFELRIVRNQSVIEVLKPRSS